MKCEECGIEYTPPKNFNPALAFAWCPKCIDSYKREYQWRLKVAIRKHLESDFKNEFEAEKWVWNNLVKSTP